MKFEIDRLRKTGLMLAGSSKIKGKQGCIGSRAARKPINL